MLGNLHNRISARLRSDPKGPTTHVSATDARATPSPGTARGVGAGAWGCVAGRSRAGAPSPIVRRTTALVTQRCMSALFARSPCAIKRFVLQSLAAGNWPRDPSKPRRAQVAEDAACPRLTCRNARLLGHWAAFRVWSGQWCAITIAADRPGSHHPTRLALHGGARGHGRVGPRSAGTTE